MPQAGSSRWSPTTEQLMILEELYRSGIRTPSASQIQQITTHLSFYGRIEGKNVFYWFQNHKARDRQKLRKKLNMMQQLQLQQQHYQLNHAYDISNYFYSYPPKEFSLFNSSTLFSQGGIVANTPDFKWGLYNPQSLMEKKDIMTICNNGWTLMDANKPYSCCTRLLKTLDLFPLTTINSKEDCTTTTHQPSSSSHI